MCEKRNQPFVKENGFTLALRLHFDLDLLGLLK